MSTNIIDIKFRNKFVKGMKFSNLARLESFKMFFSGILSKYPEFVLGLLWSMVYDSEGEVSPQKYLDDLCIFRKFSTEQQKLICSELRYQYSQLYPDFLKVDVSSNIAASYNALCNASDKITAYQVYQKIMQYIDYPEDAVKRCFFLINSPNEKNYFGGLRDLGFNKKAANYLKSFIKEIAQLFEDITENKSNPVVDNMEDLPFRFGSEASSTQAGNKDQVSHDDDNSQSSLVEDSAQTSPVNEERHVPHADEVQYLEDIVPQHDKKSLVAENVEFQFNADFAWQHKTELSNFIKALEEVESIGLSAELILSKRAEIAQLLSVSKLF